MVRVQRVFRVVFLASPSVHYCTLHAQSLSVWTLPDVCVCKHSRGSCFKCVFLSPSVYSCMFSGTFTEFVCQG